MLHSSARKAASEWVSLTSPDIYALIPAGELKWSVNFLVTFFPPFPSVLCSYRLLWLPFGARASGVCYKLSRFVVGAGNFLTPFFSGRIARKRAPVFEVFTDNINPE